MTTLYIYVLSWEGCDGGIYVYPGNMMYMAVLCMTYMVYICYIFLLSVCNAPHRLPCDTPLGLLELALRSYILRYVMTRPLTQ